MRSITRWNFENTAVRSVPCIGNESSRQDTLPPPKLYAFHNFGGGFLCHIPKMQLEVNKFIKTVDNLCTTWYTKYTKKFVASFAAIRI